MIYDYDYTSIFIYILSINPNKNTKRQPQNSDKYNLLCIFLGVAISPGLTLAQSFIEGFVALGLAKDLVKTVSGFP